MRSSRGKRSYWLKSTRVPVHTSDLAPKMDAARSALPTLCGDFGLISTTAGVFKTSSVSQCLCGERSRSNLQYHGHNQWPLLRVLGNVALQVAANLFFDYPVIGALFIARLS